MNASLWYAQLAKDQPDLFRLIHDFNARPQHWAHPQHLEAIPHRGVVEFLSDSRRGISRASRWVNEHLGLNKLETCWDFAPVHRRLALMSCTTLERLAVFVGAAVHSLKIAGTIARNQMADIKLSIGAAAHAFALRRGKLITVPPAALNLMATPAGTFGAQILATGWNWIFGLFSGEPESIRRRLALKTPHEISAVERPSLPAAQREEAWIYLRRVGAEVFSPEESQCFA